MTDNVVRLGLAVRLADPASVWPSTTVIELNPEAAGRLGDDLVGTVRAVIAALAGVELERITDVAVTPSTSGGALVRLATDSEALRALHVAARRRATSAAEALHAAVLGLD